MDADRRAFAAQLYAAGREHDARHADRLARWRNVDPQTAEMLAVLVRATKARAILEIGTRTATRRSGWPTPRRPRAPR